MADRQRRKQYTEAEKGKKQAGSSQQVERPPRIQRSQSERRSRPRREESRPRREEAVETVPSGEVEGEAEESRLDDAPSRRKHKSGVKRPSYGALKHIIRLLPLAPTRFPDPELLQQLGIYEDVKAILTAMGLQDMLHMSFHTYRILTAEFLASLDVKHFYGYPDPEHGYGYITFRANRTTHQVSFRRLSEIYGFPDRPFPKLQAEKNASTRFWLTVGSGPRKPGSNKNSHIRHPALRYVHKIIAHSFYARREPGGVNEVEMLFMDRGIAPFVGVYANGTTPLPIPHPLGVVGLFVDCLVKAQYWSYTTTDSSPKMLIAGWITPILHAVGCLDGVAPDMGPGFLDEAYLTDARYLRGRLVNNRNLIAYEYYTVGKIKVRTLLPNPARTTITVRENLVFILGPDELYRPAVHGLLEKVAGDDEEPPREQEAPEPVFGSDRYHFDPYGEPLPAGPLREAHEHIHRLSRWNRYQDRTIRKLVKTVKELKGTVKKLSKRVFGRGSSSRHHRAEAAYSEEFDDPMPEHRHSYHGEEHLTMIQYDPHGAHFEPHQPSPPQDHSGNESPSLQTPPSSDDPDYLAP